MEASAPWTREEQEVIQPDRRQLVTNTLAIPYRWICSLDVTFDRPYPKGWRDGLGRGSGLLIGPRHVLTAAHGIYPDGATRPASIKVAPARNGRRLPFGSVPAVAWTVSSRAFAKYGIDPNHDYGIVVLDRDIAGQSHAALGNQPLGFWGSERLGAGTALRALSRDWLEGKHMVVCGYPGDRCGTQPHDLDDPRARCDKADHATTQWIDNGIASVPADRPRLFHHTADTAKGQSGAPVWIKFTDGRRFLIGVHVMPNVVTSVDAKGKQRREPITANVAVHLSDEVLRLVRDWLQ
jgi:V8-like Glu-specific endopeptidase